MIIRISSIYALLTAEKGGGSRKLLPGWIFGVQFLCYNVCLVAGSSLFLGFKILSDALQMACLV